MSEKVLGYILLVVGIIIISIPLFIVYSIYNKSQKPVEIFNLPGISLDYSSIVGGEIPEAELNKAKNEGKLKTELVGAEILNQPLNLFANIILLGFIVNVGFKVASLGVQFLRPIKVNLREREEKG